MVFSRPARYFNVGVHYLDDNKSYFQMKTNSTGREFFDSICQLLGLEEKDYFGLQFIDRNGNLAWLDNEKNLRRQIWHLKNRELLFRVKFYIPNPGLLSNEYTRYLFSLQIAIDLKGGFISGSDSDIACMLSYILQADLGDYEQQNVANIDLSRSLMSCNDQIVEQCFEFYKSNQGMLKSEADIKLLDKAWKLPSYGKRFFSCNSPLISDKPLCVCTDYFGISVYEDDKQITTYTWELISNVVFRKRKLLVYFSGSDKIYFVFNDYHKCRSYWKIVFENFSFYKDVVKDKKKRVGRSSLLKRGSRFRYSGKTISVMMNTENSMNGINFERSHSSRISMHHPPRTVAIATPSKEMDIIDMSDPPNGLSWSAPLISEKELCQIGQSCFDKILSTQDDEKPSTFKRMLPLADPCPDLTYKRSFYLSTPISPNGDITPAPLNRVASRGSMWSKRRLIRTNHNKIPRIYEIVSEIYSSEKVYCRELAALTQDFKIQVEEHLTDAQFEILINQFVPMELQQSCLFPQLGENLENINEQNIIKCARHFFTTVIDSIEIYENYLSTLSELMDTFLCLVSENAEFCDLCVKFEQKLYIPVIRLLLRPTQQIFYYQLILDGICNTAMSDDYHSSFSSLYTQLCQLLSKYEKYIQNAVETVYLYELSTHVVDSHCFFAKGRRLVRIGMLNLYSSQRLVVLFSDFIVFCESVMGTDLFSISNIINWHNIESVNVENGCFFVLMEEGVEIHLEAKTLEDKHSWVCDINNAMWNFSEPSENSNYSVIGSTSFSHQCLFSSIWKYGIPSITSTDFFNLFKVTFAGPVHKKTRLSKQRFFVLLNNLNLYFFTDYSSSSQSIPECKHKMPLIYAKISMNTVSEGDEEEKYQFSLKIGEKITVLCSDSRYYQNRWAVSLESASV